MLTIILIIDGCLHSAMPNRLPFLGDDLIHLKVLMIIIIPLLLAWAAIRKERGGNILAKEYSKSEILPTFSASHKEDLAVKPISNSNAKSTYSQKLYWLF